MKNKHDFLESKSNPPPKLHSVVRSAGKDVNGTHFKKVAFQLQNPLVCPAAKWVTVLGDKLVAQGIKSGYGSHLFMLSFAQLSKGQFPEHKQNVRLMLITLYALSYTIFTKTSHNDSSFIFN